MSKIIVLYTRRNVGLIALSYLVASGFEVRVLTDEENIKWLAKDLGCDNITSFDDMGDFDIFLSVHGWKFVPEKYLKGKIAINIHPMLFRYKGHNPIQRVIENGDTKGSVESHYMTNEIDGGEVIHQEFFEIPKCQTYADYYNVALPFYFKTIEATLRKINV